MYCGLFDALKNERVFSRSQNDFPFMVVGKKSVFSAVTKMMTANGNEKISWCCILRHLHVSFVKILKSLALTRLGAIEQVLFFQRGIMGLRHERRNGTVRHRIGVSQSNAFHPHLWGFLRANKPAHARLGQETLHCKGAPGTNRFKGRRNDGTILHRQNTRTCNRMYLIGLTRMNGLSLA